MWTLVFGKMSYWLTVFIPGSVAHGAHGAYQYSQQNCQDF